MAKKSQSWSDDPRRKEKDDGHLATMEAEEPKATAPIVLPKLDIRVIDVTLKGTTPLICHRWSEKAKRQMLDKQMGKATKGREKKDPQEDYRGSLYLIEPAPAGKPFEDGVFGFPAIAFKKAAVAACTSLGKDVTKVAARQAFHVLGSLVPIRGKPRFREDMTKLNGKTADIRHRGEFPEWEVTLRVAYNARLLSDEQVVNLFNTAGFGVGVGEWRVERDGNSGMFEVA